MQCCFIDCWNNNWAYAWTWTRQCGCIAHNCACDRPQTVCRNIAWWTQHQAWNVSIYFAMKFCYFKSSQTLHAAYWLTYSMSVSPAMSSPPCSAWSAILSLPAQTRTVEPCRLQNYKLQEQAHVKQISLYHTCRRIASIHHFSRDQAKPGHAGCPWQ